MIEARGIGRRFARADGSTLRALDEVTLLARPGEVTALLGPNGSGKSTFFRVAAGLLKPHAGTLRVAGHDVTREPLRARAALGLLPEEPGLPRRLHARWHLSLHGTLHGLPPDRLRDRAARLIQELGLAGDATRPCGELSRGTRLRVALARALLHEPAVLLLDEPTAALDIEGAAALRARLAALAREGRTVLIATHNAHEAETLCACVHVLRGGRVIASGSPESLRRVTKTGSLEEAYLAMQGVS
jgi:ABC-type multidrug transport system ATPase subunit